MATQESSIPQPGSSSSAAAAGGQTGVSAVGRRRAIMVGGTLAVLAAAVAAVSVLVTAGGGPAVTRIAVQEIINRVEADRPRDGLAAAENFLPAAIGQDLVVGDGLQTYAASEARVDISVGDFIRVSRTKPNTLWRLGGYTVEDGTVIELERGKIFLFDDASETDPQPIKVVTPVGAASPRGTWLSFSYDPESEVAELQCFRGTCILENDFGKQVLVDEQKATVAQESAPLKPVLMTGSETKTFETLPEVSTGELTIPTPEPPKPEATRRDRLSTPTTEPVPSPTPAPNPIVRGTGATGDLEPNETRDLGPVRGPVIEPTSKPAATPAPLPTSTPVARPKPSPTYRPTIRPSPTPVRRPTATMAPTLTPEPLDAPLPPINSNILPHVFVGTAILDGKSAPEGTVVTAWMQGFSEPLARTEVYGSSLTLLVPQYGPGSMEGRTVEFRLNGLDTNAIAVWSTGGADILVLEASSSGQS